MNVEAHELLHHLLGLNHRKYRPMVERSIAWLVRDHYRRVRFRGVERNQMGLSTRVAAINLRRLITLGLIHDAGWRLATTYDSASPGRQ